MTNYQLPITIPMLNNLYDIDFYAWTQEQAKLIRDRKWGETNLPDKTFPIDCAYTLEEILSDRFFPGEPYSDE